MLRTMSPIMKSWIYAYGLLMLFLWTARAMEVRLDEALENQQSCTGMYSKSTWGGPVDPVILLKFTDVGKDQGDDPTVSLVIFEWKDEDLIGIQIHPDSPAKVGICDQAAVTQQYCNQTDIGEWILSPNATELSKNVIFTKAVHLKSSTPYRYPIKNTGYYCVLTRAFTSGTKYEAIAEFRNAYGELAATQIPKLPFYGGMTLLYALALAFWMFLWFQHRSDILAVQNYITAILIFLVVEMLLTWAFYGMIACPVFQRMPKQPLAKFTIDYQNRNGSNAGSRALLGIVAFLNAARNSFSFFLLLIVCMGYGVVKPTLGRTMIYARWLAIAHFVFGLVYSATSLLITPDSAGPLVLLIILPLAGTLTAFYVWTLNSLNFTLKDLHERKQHVKEAMYKKLWWSILLSIIVIFGFFFLNSLSFAKASDPDYVPFHWKSRWFVLDGWLNLVYFADVAWIAYIWRPTANNRRFAMSDELAQEDDGTFDLSNLDVAAPDDSDFDEETRVGHKTDDSDTPPSSNSGPRPPTSRVPSGQLPSHRGKQAPPRESTDGETIFAVGEDGDRFTTDDEDEDGELVKKRVGK